LKIYWKLEILLVLSAAILLKKINKINNYFFIILKKTICSETISIRNLENSSNTNFSANRTNFFKFWSFLFTIVCCLSFIYFNCNSKQFFFVYILQHFITVLQSYCLSAFCCTFRQRQCAVFREIRLQKQFFFIYFIYLSEFSWIRYNLLRQLQQQQKYILLIEMSSSVS